MQVIYKYPFRPNDEVYIEMPIDARILSVQVQNGVPCIWALVDTDLSVRSRLFMIYGTGHEIHNNIDKAEFIGTIQMHNGALVFHVFDFGY